MTPAALAAPLAALLLAQPAAAQGFAETDLSRVAVDVAAFEGRRFTARAEPARLTLACLDCAPGFEAVDVLTGRDDEGLEAAHREGRLTIAALERDCRAQDPSCRLRSLSAGPAVGWISEWTAPGGPASTVVLLRGGDKLVIRSLADAPDAAVANALVALELVASQVIGD